MIPLSELNTYLPYVADVLMKNNRDPSDTEVSVDTVIKALFKSGIEEVRSAFESCDLEYHKQRCVKEIGDATFSLLVQEINDPKELELITEIYKGMQNPARKAVTEDPNGLKRKREAETENNEEIQTKKQRLDPGAGSASNKMPSFSQLLKPTPTLTSVKTEPEEGSEGRAAINVPSVPSISGPFNIRGFSLANLLGIPRALQRIQLPSFVARPLQASSIAGPLNASPLSSSYTPAPPKTIQIVGPGASANPAGTNSQQNSAAAQSSSTAKKASKYSAAEKETMVNFLLENFPKIEPKVLYLALRHYHFSMQAFFEDYNSGKVNFTDLEKRYLLEEYATVKNRLDEIETLVNPNTSQIQQELAQQIQNNEEGDILENFIPPKYWEQGRTYRIGHYKLVPVVLHLEEGLEVLERFYRNDQKSRQVFEVKSVTRIENAKEYSRFSLQQKVVKLDTNNQLDTQTLFHGTALARISKIARRGFDLRMAGANGAAGKAIYFAQFPRTSLTYIRDCPPTEMKVLLCRVECGAKTAFSELHKAFPFASPANPIIIPQPRDSNSADSLPFDSSYGFMRDDQNHPIVAVYDSSLAYAEYIITFAINENRIVRGPPTSAASVINWQHPRYRAQIEETKKSLKFLERTLAFDPNRDKPAYETLDRLHTLLLQNPDDKDSLHQKENITLEQLQSLARFYNMLSANNPIILLGEDTYNEPTPTALQHKSL
jgi:hypothetical protein